MKRNARKLCAVVLMVSMLFSLLPGAAFAAPANGNSGLKQYTSMEDLIQDAIDELLAQGAVSERLQADATMVNMVESKSDKTFDELKTVLSDGVFEQYHGGFVNTVGYNLTATEMSQVLDYILQSEYLADDVTYECETQNGIVTAVRFDASDAFVSALESLKKMNQDITVDANIIAEATVEAADNVAPKTRLFSLAREASDEADTSELFQGCSCEQAHVTSATSINFTWIENPGNGDLDPTDQSNYDLVYAPENENSKNGIAAELRELWYGECTGATYTCPTCGNEVTVTADASTIQTQRYTLYINVTNGEQVQKEYGAELTAEEQQILVKYFDFDVAILLVPVMEGEEVIQQYATSSNETGMYNISELRTKKAYPKMRNLIYGKPECFGIPTPFWTSKATESNPFGAIKIALNMEESDPDIPAVYADYLPGLTSGFAALVYYYQDALLGVVSGAQEALQDAAEMAPEYKMLILHDWLANNSIFDMSNLLALSGETAESSSEESSDSADLTSLIGMTPFSMLSTAIGYKGGVCLGYTASYAYLVQNAFPENYYKDGNIKNGVLDDPAEIVDFVKIKFNADMEDCSVAGSDSGFIDEENPDKRFTQPHFFNAVNLTNPDGENNWYFVDACYDDVNPEVISQYRVETDGNISHMYFLSAPSTLESQFEGKCDYIDSLYDGKTYIRPGSDESQKWASEQEYQAAVESGKDSDGNEVEAGWEWVENDEPRGTDETYENAWFSNAQSEIILYGDSWYYVEGENAYNSMKDFNQGGDIDFGENGGDLMDMMGSQLDDPDSAHQIKRRPVSANDKLEGSSIEIDMNAAGGDAADSYTKIEDPEAYGLFHYGYGYVNYGKGGINTKELAYDGADDDATEDMEYRKMYPELSHGIGLYDNKLYFNIGNKIMCYDIMRDGAGNDIGTVSQVKEYNDVYAKKFEANSGELFFAGGSFMMVNEEDADYTFRYHPIAGLSIHDEMVVDEAEGTAEINTNMYVAIATNLSESYKGAEGDKNKYEVEAVNYNPSYQRYLDDGSDETINSNTEFMWCPNVVETMPMDAMTAELAALKDGTATNTAEVTVAAYCEKEEFKETRTNEEFPEYTKGEHGRVTGTKRTADFGLSDGSTKVETEDTALNHKYAWSETEQTYICSRCNHCDEDYVPTENPGDVNGNGEVDVDDLSALARYLGGFTDDDFNLKNANVDGNDVVDVDDLTALARKLGGYED